jgi:hypothetical protein
MLPAIDYHMYNNSGVAFNTYQFWEINTYCNFKNNYSSPIYKLIILVSLFHNFHDFFSQLSLKLIFYEV